MSNPRKRRIIRLVLLINHVVVPMIATMAASKRSYYYFFTTAVSKWIKRILNPSPSTNSCTKATPLRIPAIVPYLPPACPITPPIPSQSNQCIPPITIDDLLLLLGAHDNDTPTTSTHRSTLVTNDGDECCGMNCPPLECPALVPSPAIPTNTGPFHTSWIIIDEDYTQKSPYASRRQGRIFLSTALRPFSTSQWIKRAPPTVNTHVIPATVNPPSLISHTLWDTLLQPIVCLDAHVYPDRVSLSPNDTDSWTLMQYIRDEIALDCNDEDDVINTLRQRIACDEDQEESNLIYHHTNSPGDEKCWTDIINIDDY